MRVNVDGCGCARTVVVDAMCYYANNRARLVWPMTVDGGGRYLCAAVHIAAPAGCGGRWWSGVGGDGDGGCTAAPLTGAHDSLRPLG